jgi:aminopeptidase N
LFPATPGLAFGAPGLVTITTYLSRSALEERHPDVIPWSADISRTLPDHAYADNAAALKQLETMIGKQALMNGLGGLLRQHANGRVTKDDLVRSWSNACGHDLRGWFRSRMAK